MHQAAGIVSVASGQAYLSAEMEIAEQNGRLRASDDEDDKDQEEESVHVVDVKRPDGVQDEKQLNEDATEGQNSTHDDPRNWLQKTCKQFIIIQPAYQIKKPCLNNKPHLKTQFKIITKVAWVKKKSCALNVS